MATKTFWLKDATAASSNHGSLQDGGSAPTAGTTGTGWIVAKIASGNYALQDYDVERSSGNFGTTALPNAGPNNTLGDCWRSEGTLSGTFASGDWTIGILVIAVTGGGEQDGRARVRVWKGAAADGSDAVEMTGGTTQLSTVTNLGTASTQQSTGTVSVTNNLALNNEYLFLQVAWEITGAGGNNNRDVLMRVGDLEGGFVANAVTTDFTAAQTISPGGLASAEAFGTAQLDIAVDATGNGVASAEAFGTATVSHEAAGQSISDAGAIASAEAFGTVQVDQSIAPSGSGSEEAFGIQRVDQRVDVSGVASAEAFGASAVQPGPVAISPPGIASEEAFGGPRLDAQVDASGIASGEAFGSAEVQPGPVTVSPNGIASEETFGETAIGSFTVVSPSSIDSAEMFGDTTVQPGPVTVSPTGIDSAEAFGTLRADLEVSPGGVASAEAFGSTRVDLSVAPAGVASEEIFGDARLDLHVEPSSIVSAETFGDAAVQSGVTNISPSSIASEEAFGDAEIQPGDVTVSPSGVASLEAFGEPTVGAFTVVEPSGIPSEETFGVNVLGMFVVPTSIFSEEAFGTPELGLRVAPSGVASLEAFGGGALGLAVAPPGIASLEEFGLAAVVPDAVVLSPPSVASAEVFGTPSVSATLDAELSPSSIASAEAFGASQIDIRIRAFGISSALAFGRPRFLGVADLRSGPARPLVTFGQLRAVPLTTLHSRAYSEDRMGLKVGSVAVIDVTVKELGAAVNPASLSLLVTDPDGAETTYVFGVDGEIEEILDASAAHVTGKYRARVPMTKAKKWSYVWTSTGPNGVDDGYIDVE